MLSHSNHSVLKPACLALQNTMIYKENLTQIYQLCIHEEQEKSSSFLLYKLLGMLKTLLN